MRAHPEENARRPTRVAIVLETPKPQAWIAKIVQDVCAAEFSECTVYLQNNDDRALSDFGNGAGSALFRLYLRQEKKIYATELDPFRATDLVNIGLTELDVMPAGSSLADVVLWLSSRPPDKQKLKNIGCRIWYYRHGLPQSGLPQSDLAQGGLAQTYSGETAYFWQLYDRDPVTVSAVVELNGDNECPAVLAESSAVAEPGWSVTANSIAPLWKASSLFLKCLTQLQNGYPERQIVEPPRNCETKRGVPSYAQMANFFIRNLSRTVYRRLLFLNRDVTFFVAYRTNSEHFVSRRDSFSGEGFRRIEAPQGHYFADPFVWTRNGQSYIFVEDYIHAKRKGVISVVPVQGDHVGQPEQVLEQPYHLSYPCVFEYEGELYMIPETLDSRRVELYRADKAPFKWELVCVLKDDIAAADTTPWIENGIYYFFTSVAERGVTANENLHLYYAESLTGKWVRHPASPVCFDARRSRSAGHLFRRNGKLLRPAQDCSVRYGYACELSEIEELSPSSFREKPVSRIEPNWSDGLIGTHTINSDQYIEVIDGQVYRRKERGRTVESEPGA